MRPRFTKVQQRRQERAGRIRTAPLILAVDTGRWFMREPEQLALAIKNHEGALFCELAHMVRRPERHKPFRQDRKSGKWYRIPDRFQQHTKQFRYCLDNPTHARALQQLLRHSMAYTAGHDAGALQQGDYKDLYWLPIGDTHELARWPIDGLMKVEQQRCWHNGKLVLDDEDLHGDAVPVEPGTGHEILEVVCIPGERPRKPAAVLGARPTEERARARYDRELAHWHHQLQSCQSKQLQLRVRRVHGPKNEPAFFFNDAVELDIPLKAVRRWAEQLPAWWKIVYRHFEKEANLGWPRMDRRQALHQPRVYLAYPALRMTWKEHRDHFTCLEWNVKGTRRVRVRRGVPKVSATLSDQRQFAWTHRVMQQFLSPTIMTRVCEAKPQDGLWSIDAGNSEVERGSEEYLQRLALWHAGKLRWDPEWSVAIQQAREDLKELRVNQRDRLEEILRMFLIMQAIKYNRRPKPVIVPSTPLKLTSYCGATTQVARGPPAAVQSPA